MNIHTLKNKTGKPVLQKGCSLSEQSNTIIPLILLSCFVLLLPTKSFAQSNWYYHTINSHSLAALAGQTAKFIYSYQMTHQRQLKISGAYIHDKFDIGRDEVKSDIYLLSGQYQYQFYNYKGLFLNSNVGIGGYILRADNRLEQEVNEEKLLFTSGFQVEYYLYKANLAILFDYDILYTPFSNLYEFLHTPTIGLLFNF